MVAGHTVGDLTEANARVRLPEAYEQLADAATHLENNGRISGLVMPDGGSIGYTIDAVVVIFAWWAAKGMAEQIIAEKIADGEVTP